MKHITYLEKKEITESFQDDVLKIGLEIKDIRRIIKIDPFLNLTYLSFYSNKISKIEGLNNLTNLHCLGLSENKINKIEGLDTLVNLETLYLSGNQITKIEGLNNLINLHTLSLPKNKITKIDGLDTLINLHVLNLSENQITKIEELNNLINLHYLYLTTNQITEINDPSQFIPCINLINFYYDYNIIVHPVIIRFLNRNKLKNNKLHIFNDSQNVHDNSINRTIIESVNRLMKDVLLKDTDQTELMNDPILTKQTKQILLEYMSHSEQHSLLLLSFAELFGIVWQVIEKHPDASTIKEVLNQEMNDSICKCFTGRMNRLVNVLNGFDERVVIKIADSYAIANVIIMLQKQYTNIKELKETIHKELIERGYVETVIKDWIDFIE